MAALFKTVKLDEITYQWDGSTGALTGHYPDGSSSHIITVELKPGESIQRIENLISKIHLSPNKNMER